MGMDVYGKKPTKKQGEYFRANIWSWRPIHALCETVLKRELPGWEFNNGEGFDAQPECTELADALEKYLAEFPKDEISVESELRVNEDGSFLLAGRDGRPVAVRHRPGARQGVRCLPALLRGIRDPLMA